MQSLFGNSPGDGYLHSPTTSSDGLPITRASSVGSGAVGNPFPKAISDKYRLGEELGRGAFGKVFKGIDTSTGEHVAVKQLSLDRLGAEQLTGISNEVELLKALNHRNVVKYLGSFRTKHHLYIIMEYVENGALSNVIKQSKFGPFPESLVAVYVQQVLQGLAYLHEQGVVHRDIKGANILTTREGLVKLADFGVAAKLGDIDEKSSEAAPAGTPYWMAPEVVELKTVTTASDIWSVGCVAVELLTGQPPYYELQPLSALYNIVQDPHPPLPLGASTAMQEFLLQCFNKDPASRPSARQLLQHPWIIYNRKTLRNTWTKTRKTKGDNVDVHTSVTSVIERILAAESDDGSVTTNESPKAFIDSTGPDSVADSAVDMVAREEQIRQEEFLERVAHDPRGTQLLRSFEGMKLSPAGGEAPLHQGVGRMHHGATPVEEAELLRQVASLTMNGNPGERNLQQEAAAAASARVLVSYVRRDASLRALFIAAGGISGCRELLDSPAERVLLPVLDLLCALVEPRDPGIIDAMCLLGVLPAALRLSGPTHPLELRLHAGRLAESLALASERGMHLLVACQGIPFFIGMIDDAPQSAAQLELVRIAVSGCWAILHHSQTPGWLIQTNQYLRLMAHHGLPGKIVRALPWVLKRSTEVINSLRTSQQHSRSSTQDSLLQQSQQRLGGRPASGQLSASWSSTSSSSLKGSFRSGTNKIAPEESLRMSADVSSSGDTITEQPGTSREVMEKLAALLEAMVNLFAVLSHGDTVVKTRMCQLETINTMFGLTTRMPPHLQLRTLQCVRRLAGDHSTLPLLEGANAIAYAVAQLGRDDNPSLQAEALCTLQLLTQLNRARQEKLVASGATSVLCRLAVQPPEGNSVDVNLSAAAQGSTVAILCSLAHAGPSAIQELWRSGGLDIFLQLLKEEAYQASVLEALATWLDIEPNRLEPALLEQTAVSRLVFLLPEASAEDEQLQSVVSPLARIVFKSPRLAVALADNGLALRVVDLLKRPNPRTALALLELLRLLYENQSHPKEFIIKYRVQPTLAALARGGPEGDQVLVRKQAQNLLKAFQVNSVF